MTEEYDLYVKACAEQGHFALNYMNWSASRKYEQEKARFQEHFLKLQEQENAGKGREETAAE